MKRHSPNFRRDIIINNNLLEYINMINTSDRNKDITIKYANGISYKELSKEHNITTPRVASIVWDCLCKCKRIKNNPIG
jgi:Mor family transcriptional regulator